MRIHNRQTNGRYSTGSLLGTLGLNCITCPHCQGFNPWKQGLEPKPETCCQCGKPLAAKAEEAATK